MPLSDEQTGPYKRDGIDIPASSGAAAPGRKPVAFPVTKLILAANILIFAIMAVVSGGQAFAGVSPEMMLAWGADHGPETLSHEQYWRLLSSCFLHFDALHIAFNMYALWNCGPSVEKLFGSSKFLFMYLLAGVGASLVSLAIHPQGLSAGASGAVFGVFGSFLTFLRLHRAAFEKDSVTAATRSILVLIVVNLIWGFSRQGIDNAAHIGGFLTGAAAGFACLPKDPRSHAWSKRNVISCLFLISLLLFGMQMRIDSYDRLP